MSTNSKRSSSASCVGAFVALLQVVFIVLKLIEKIDWSWWWVLSPIWITAIIAFVIAFVMFMYIILYNDGLV